MMYLGMDGMQPESIEWFIERARLSLVVVSIDSSPTAPFPPSTGDTQEDWERETSFWRESGEEGEQGA